MARRRIGQEAFGFAGANGAGTPGSMRSGGRSTGVRSTGFSRVSTPRPRASRAGRRWRCSRRCCCHVARPVGRTAGRGAGRPGEFPAVLWVFGKRGDAGTDGFRAVPGGAGAGAGSTRSSWRAVVRQLDAKRLVVKTGTLIDATVIAAASKDDGEAGVERPCRAAGGQGLQGACGDRRDGRDRAQAGGDAGQRARQPRARAGAAGPAGTGLRGRRLRPVVDAGAIRAAGGRPHIPRRHHRRSRPARNAAKAAWNAAIRPVRARIEKVFGTAKRSYGLAPRPLARTRARCRCRST